MGRRRESPIRRVGIIVRQAMREGGPELRAEMLRRLRLRANAAVERLGKLVNARGRRGSQQVSLSASRLLLTLLEKAEAQVEDDRLNAVEEAIEKLKAAGWVPGAEGGPTVNPLTVDGDARPAPGADGRAGAAYQDGKCGEPGCACNDAPPAPGAD